MSPRKSLSTLAQSFPTLLQRGAIAATVATDNIFCDAQPLNCGAQPFNANSRVGQMGAVGYRKRADGSIHQWGVVAGNAAADTTITFPISFSSELHDVNARTLDVVDAANTVQYVPAAAQT